MEAVLGPRRKGDTDDYERLMRLFNEAKPETLLTAPGDKFYCSKPVAWIDKQVFPNFQLGSRIIASHSGVVFTFGSHAGMWGCSGSLPGTLGRGGGGSAVGVELLNCSMARLKIVNAIQCVGMAIKNTVEVGKQANYLSVEAFTLGDCLTCFQSDVGGCSNACQMTWLTANIGGTDKAFWDREPAMIRLHGPNGWTFNDICCEMGNPTTGCGTLLIAENERTDQHSPADEVERDGRSRALEHLGRQPVTDARHRQDMRLEIC